MTMSLIVAFILGTIFGALVLYGISVSMYFIADKKTINDKVNAVYDNLHEDEDDKIK